MDIPFWSTFLSSLISWGTANGWTYSGGFFTSSAGIVLTGAAFYALWIKMTGGKS